MKRSTYKEFYEDYKNEERVCYNIIPNSNVSHQDCLNKLGQVEDLEQELSIDIQNDLSKLLLASKNGFWVKKGYKNIKTHKREYQLAFYDYAYFYYADDMNCWLIATIDNSYALFQYGDTWALTKEELEGVKK